MIDDLLFEQPWQEEIAVQDERDREALESLDEREPEEGE